jgi:hypothetical protein
MIISISVSGLRRQFLVDVDLLPAIRLAADHSHGSA